MGQYIVNLLLDDTIPAQATLLGQIQTNLAGIASNLVSTSANPSIQNQIENIGVRRIA